MTLSVYNAHSSSIFVPLIWSCFLITSASGFIHREKINVISQSPCLVFLNIYEKVSIYNTVSQPSHHLADWIWVTCFNLSFFSFLTLVFISVVSVCSESSLYNFSKYFANTCYFTFLLDFKIYPILI